MLPIEPTVATAVLVAERYCVHRQAPASYHAVRGERHHYFKLI
jgi:hypothetical protein